MDDIALLVRSGRSVHERNEHGETPLFAAFKEGGAQHNVDKNISRNEVHVHKQGKHERAPWRYRVCEGNPEAVRELIRCGADVDARNNMGVTPLMCTAVWGTLEILQELIRCGANVDAADKGGRTPLSRAAQAGMVSKTRELIQSGAVIDFKDNNGRTPLSHATEWGDIEMMIHLLEAGASVNLQDDHGQTPLSCAAENSDRDAVQALAKRGAVVDVQHRSGRTLLSQAAKQGDNDMVRVLVGAGAAVDATGAKLQLPSRESMKGARTPLFYAVESGHADVVKTLIDNGACFSAKTHSCLQPRETETLLTVAGRKGDMKIFQVLIDAGAPVNTRSTDGETPLILAARRDCVAVVQSLISHGGCLRVEDVQDDEFPLIPGTLTTMTTMCEATFEFEAMSTGVLKRMETICLELQQLEDVREAALVSFASIIFHFCRLLFRIEQQCRPLSRSIGSRATAERIQGFHEELDHYALIMRLKHTEINWRVQWREDKSNLQLQFEELLSDDNTLLSGYSDISQRMETAFLIQYELQTRDRDLHSRTHTSMTTVLQRFLHLCELETPVVPEWFISRDDVESHSANLVRAQSGIYEGKWQKSTVMIEMSNDYDPQLLAYYASQWFQFSHPNVIQLYGACHIDTPYFLVYELVPDGMGLSDFVSAVSNHELT